MCILAFVCMLRSEVFIVTGVTHKPSSVSAVSAANVQGEVNQPL